MRAAAVLGFLALVVLPELAFADPITITFSYRWAHAVASTSTTAPPAISTDSASDSVFATTTSNSAQGSATGSASMVSSIQVGNLSGAGSSRATVNSSGTGASGWSDAQASGSYQLGFSLPQAYEYSFYASFVGDDTTPFDPDGLNVKTDWSAELRAGTTGAYEFTKSGTGNGLAVQSGRLTAGNWQLFVTDYAEAFAPVGGLISAASQYDFTLTLAPSTTNPSPTPEPASLLLLGTAVAGLFGARRRRASFGSVISTGRGL